MNRAYCFICITIFPIAGYSYAAAKTWHIYPNGTGDAPSIQAGVDSAVAGDVVLLSTGTFSGEHNRNIDFHGKEITVTSESGAGFTIIDCDGFGRGFIFRGAKGANAVVSNITIANGSESYGGGIFCSTGSSPTIKDNTFYWNGGSEGGGIYCQSGSAPLIENNYFVGNSAIAGGGIACNDASPVISQNIFSENKAGYVGGNAIYCRNGASPTISHNVMVWGEIYKGYGTILCEGVGTNPIIENCILFRNFSGTISYFGGALPIIRCCDIMCISSGDEIGGVDGSGNFSADPQFCGALGSMNFYLQSDSPCAPGNHPNGYDCGLIGVSPIGCGLVDSQKMSWGEIKAMYE